MKTAKEKVIKSATERLFEALEVLNAIRLPKAESAKDELFGDPESDITDKNYMNKLKSLWKAVQPLRALKQQLRPPRFDILGLYQARKDGTPTKEAAINLIGRLHWTLAQLLKPSETTDGESFGKLRPNAVTSFMEAHFAGLSRKQPRENFLLSVKWGYLYDKPGAPFLPKLVVAVPGVDSQAWLTLLEFLRENPQYRDLLGRCSQCRKFFRKPRRDAQYCSSACASKTRYERWKRRGGLRRRKLQRRRA